MCVDRVSSMCDWLVVGWLIVGSRLQCMHVRMYVCMYVCMQIGRLIIGRS